MQYFTRALNIFISSRADPALIAEVHYHYADVLAQKGSYDKAVEHAQKCRKIRESCFGFSDIRVIHSCRQVAKFLREPYKDYQGVMTGIVKAAYRESIACHEKVFRYLQNQQGTSRRRSIRRSHSINSMYSMSSSLSQPGMRSAIQTHPGSENKLVMAGPLVVSPFGWTPPFPKNLLHRLTKDIVGMKLALIDAPAQKECIRMLRMKRSQGTLEHGNALAFDPEEARAIIMKMAAVTPSVYLDDVMQRVSEGDDTAVYELGVVLVLTESETVGLSN